MNDMNSSSVEIDRQKVIKMCLRTLGSIDDSREQLRFAKARAMTAQSEKKSLWGWITRRQPIPYEVALQIVRDDDANWEWSFDIKNNNVFGHGPPPKDRYKEQEAVARKLLRASSFSNASTVTVSVEDLYFLHDDVVDAYR